MFNYCIYRQLSPILLKDLSLYSRFLRHRHPAILYNAGVLHFDAYPDRGYAHQQPSGGSQPSALHVEFKIISSLM